MCLFAKRLEDGRFRWPKVEDGVVRLTAAQLSALLEELDWVRVHEARESRAPLAACEQTILADEQSGRVLLGRMFYFAS